ncbi:MAG: hypothetical protein EZS28_034740 [Streblomastix strix]|uniref:Reverse transcriptase domain-containing protein n=1 Tax=Streblomastix strix TaxID=222440 RepID=A0A5J4UHU3_9EUKA|nr:MAG: hypothetical protein EZS28_034740 [Streblomastix strix]
MRTAPQEMEERIGELIYKEKDNGMLGKTKRFIQAWKQIRKEDFINTGFYLRFQEQESQQRLEENKGIIQFRGTQEEKKAYQEMLKDELEEGIIIPILTGSSEMVEPFIPDKETQWNMEKDSGCEQVKQRNREITLQDAWTRRSTIASQLNRLCNISRPQISISPHHTMPFGTKHSPIFFAEAIEPVIRQIRIHSEIKILNYCDDILLIHQNKQILKTQTMKIMRTLEKFGWTISTEKCETEPKQIITFLGWIWNLKEMNIRMSQERKLKMIQALKDWCNIIQKSKSVKIRQLAALIGRLNFLRPQIKKASLYLMDLDKANTQILKAKSLDDTMIVSKSIIKELKRCIRRIGDNQPEPLITRTITCILTTDASPLGQKITLMYDNQVKLIQHDCWNEKEAEMTSNAKEIKAIYYGLLRFEHVFKKMQDQAVLIRSNNTTAVYDIGK